MKRKYMTWMIAAAVAGNLLTGCGQAAEKKAEETTAGSSAQETTQETTAQETAAKEAETEAAGDFIPADFIQEQTNADIFDSYNDIISCLSGENEGFAYIQLTGSTSYVLAVSDHVSAEYGTATEASFYAYNKEDKLVNVGLAFGDENHPLRCDDSTLYACTDTEYGEMQINADSNGLTYTRCMDKNQSEDSKITYSGFVREAAEGDSTEDHSIETEEQFTALFDKLSDVPAISFTRAAYASYDEIIAQLPVDAGYAYINLNGYEGDILATCTSTYEDNGVHCGIDATLYVENNGKAELLASIQTGGTAYPVTVDGGILYYNTPRQYAEEDVTTNAEGRYQLNDVKYASVSYDDKGEASFETKGAISASDITSEDDFHALYEESEGKTPVDFTVIKE